MLITHNTVKKVPTTFKIGDWFLFENRIYFVVLGHRNEKDGEKLYNIFNLSALTTDTMHHSDLLDDNRYQYLGRCNDLTLTFDTIIPPGTLK